MMNRKLIVGLLFIGLIAVWVIKGNAPAERGIARLSFSGLASEKVTGIEIAGKNPIALEKREGLWIVGKREANDAAVQGLLAALGNLKSSNLVTERSSKFPDFELDDAQALRVNISQDGTVVADFWLGKAAKGGSYLRSEGRVFHVKGVFPHQFSKPLSSWVERKLFKFSGADIEKVSATLKGQALWTLVRDQAGILAFAEAMKLPADFRVDQKVQVGLVDAIAGLRVKEFIEEPAVQGKRDESFLLEVQLKGHSEKLSIRLNTNSEGDVFMGVSERSIQALLPLSIAKSLRKSLEDFRNLHPMDFNEGEIKQLTLQDGKKFVRFKRSAEGQWQLESSRPKAKADFVFDPSMVDRRLGFMKALRAGRLGGSKRDFRVLSKHRRFIDLIQADGSKLRLRVGAVRKFGDKKEALVRGNVDGLGYWVDKGSVDRLLGGIETFKKMAPPLGLGNLDPSVLKSLPPQLQEQLRQQIHAEKRKQEMMKQITKK